MKYYIKKILETIPETRDDDDLLIIKVGLNHNLNPKDFASIIRQRAFVQQHNPQLRGEKYLERQKHSRVFKEKLRQQEKPEDLKYNSRIKFKKEKPIKLEYTIEDEAKYLNSIGYECKEVYLGDGIKAYQVEKKHNLLYKLTFGILGK